MWYQLKQKLKQIKCIYKPVHKVNEYKWEKEKEKEKKTLQKFGFEICMQINKALCKTNFIWFYTYGSLLGLIREGQLLKHDRDIDIGIIEDKNFSWKELETTLEKNGFELLHQFLLNPKITERTYVYKNIRIDFFLYSNNKEIATSYVYFRKPSYQYKDNLEFSVSALKSHKIIKIKTLEIEGSQYKVPENSEEYLADIYGKSWKIPNPNWVSEKGPAWNELKGQFGYYVKKRGYK